MRIEPRSCSRRLGRPHAQVALRAGRLRERSLARPVTRDLRAGIAELRVSAESLRRYPIRDREWKGTPGRLFAQMLVERALHVLGDARDVIGSVAGSRGGAFGGFSRGIGAVGRELGARRRICREIVLRDPLAHRPARSDDRTCGRR